MAHAPVFTVRCRAPQGQRVDLLYRPSTSALTTASGQPLFSDRQPLAYEEACRIAPSNPGRKTAQVRTLKIQLGLACNYGCSYCNQASHAGEAVATRTDDAAAFLARLGDWLEGSPDRVEFWGGEPLLYLRKLQRLAPALRQRFPAATFSMVSNGSLLDDEAVQLLRDCDIDLTLSHDGPGQHLRGADPLDQPERRRALRRLTRARPGRVGFHVVLTPANANIARTRHWFEERLEDEDIAVDTEGIVSIYDDQALRAGAWREDDYRTLHESIVEGFATGVALKYRGIAEKARELVQSVRSARPALALGQKCGMDLPHQLAVDLKGNVLTCQNTGAEGRHRLGHVAAIDDVRVDTATHWSHRGQCSACPVLQLCRGSCMFLDGRHFAASCENEFRFHRAILVGALQAITGWQVEEILGGLPRQTWPRVIPLAAVDPPAPGLQASRASGAQQAMAACPT